MYNPVEKSEGYKMERSHFLIGFSQRIIQCLQRADLISSTSKAGVKVKKLAEIAGCSHQMARRYVLGEALPEIDVTYKIAKWLGVSPGWLLFGDDGDIPNNIGQKNLIQIEADVLAYILSKCTVLYALDITLREVVNFVMDLINDATHIDAGKKEIFKIIDISIHSALRFNGLKKDEKTSLETFSS